jgi:predicted membrane channel-forming protein YqfA (hemolysin III family)
MICSVVATSILGCDVCTACRVVCYWSHTTQHAVHTSQPKILVAQRCISYNDVFLLINSTIL